MSPSHSRVPRARRTGWIAGPIAAVLMLSGCGSDDPPAGSAATAVGSSALATATGAETASSATTSAEPGSPTATSATSRSSQSSGSSEMTGSSAADPSSSTGGPGLDAKGCIADFDPNADYYPNKQHLDFAKTLTISYQKSYQVVTVTPSGGTPESYVLLHCGAPKPKLTGELSKAQIVTTPVDSLYSASTSHLPSLVELGSLDTLTGVSSASFVSEKQVLDRFAQHKPVEFAPTGPIDAERVVTGKPDVLIGSGFPDPSDGKIKAAGVPVLQDLDFAEPDPLGRAEWIKFFAALTGTEGKAATAFDAIVTDYQATAKVAAGAEPVQIIPGQPYQGAWYVPGGKSWNAKLFADAGGTTAWAKDTTGASIQTTFEAVFAKAAKSPVWLASTTWTTEKQALAEDPRFAKFAAFAAHNVWNPVKGTSKAGGNPYYELGVARPDLVLADLVAILHPEKMPDHEFTFYLKLR